MYLQSIQVRNFRCFDDKGVEVMFQPGVNVVIGENNTGKSALVDALRLGFCLGAGRRDIYVSSQDFHLREDGTYADEIGLDFIFGDLSEEEEAVFLEMLVLGPPITAQLHLRYRREVTHGIERIKPSIWGGEKEGQAISFEALELINHVFLGALRDAGTHLRPGRGSRIGQLLRKLVADDAGRKRVVEHIVTANRSILQEKEVKQVGAIINRHLLDIEQTRLHQEVQLGLVSPEFGRVADSLRVLLPLSRIGARASFTDDEWEDLLARNSHASKILETKVESDDGRVLFDLSALSETEQQSLGDDTFAEILEHVVGIFELDQNGMGYNNLIYMGAVLGDLRERKNIEPYSYNSLLIEEPEAHLHPQLQDLVFDFLERVSTPLGDAGDNQGAVQVFVTSHSPVLTSRAKVDCVVVLFESPQGRISATPLRNCPLDPDQKSDLRRYLDVTKAQLFFAKGVLLVEGISEAMLLPIFAKRLGRNLEHNAIEVVSVSGTAFEPFARLFNSADPLNRIDIPCAIITDDDRCTSGEDPNRLTPEDLKVRFAGKDKTSDKGFTERSSSILAKLKSGQESARAGNARAMEGGRLTVCTAYKTLEYELAKKPTNVEPMLVALESEGIHPVVGKRLRELFKSEVVDPELRAICLWLAVKDSKAVFAQRLAAPLDKYDHAGKPVVDFEVPEYITEAIKHVAPIETPANPMSREGLHVQAI